MCHTASFLLPRRLDSASITQAHFANGRAMVEAAAYGHGQSYCVCDPAQSIVVLEVTLVLDGETERYRYSLVVQKATLLSHNHHSTNAVSATPMAVTVPWHDWNRRTRMLPGALVGSTCVHGTRYAAPIADAITRPWSLKMHNFNPRRRSVQVQLDRPRDGVANAIPDRAIDTVTVLEESIIQSRVFADPVRTSLPYHVASADLLEWSTPMMDESYILITDIMFHQGVSSSA